MRYSRGDLECLESIIRIIKYLQFCQPSLPRCPSEEMNLLSWQWCILEKRRPNARTSLSNYPQLLKKMDLIFQLRVRPQPPKVRNAKYVAGTERTNRWIIRKMKKQQNLGICMGLSTYLHATGTTISGMHTWIEKIFLGFVQAGHINLILHSR